MFGKMTLTIEKSALLGTLGLVLASCALILFQRAITRIVLGQISATDKRARSKGTVLLLISLPLLFAGIYIMLKSDKIVGLLTQCVEIIMAALPVIQI